LDRIEEGLHYELCYPIIAAALSTTLSQLHHEALRHMPRMVEKLTNEGVEGSLVPAIVELFSTSDDVKVVCACVQCLADCLSKLNHDWFSENVVPRITAAWNRLGEPAGLADACLYLIERLNPSIDIEMREVVPMVSEILASEASPPPTQLALCNYIKDRTAQLFAPKKSTTATLWSKREPVVKKAPEVRVDRVEINPYRAPPVESAVRQAPAPVSWGTGPRTEVEETVQATVQPATQLTPTVARPSQDVAPTMFAGMNAKPAKAPAASLFSGLKMGGPKTGKG
jgi:hypothetical protein